LALERRVVLQGFVVFAGVFEGGFWKSDVFGMDFLWTARGEMCGKGGWWKSLFRGAEIMQIFQLFFADSAGAFGGQDTDPMHSPASSVL
jgi:hypothetical protein